ncbi:hypothetical protein FA95DRAFT_1603332 [Auriscalpium vulgare]|uniref:Uncharacterized protein n=1 Tax=Auriscalpium vulgare TaxID=40419 RepID=A0ACB8S3U2_9AGAM|nr:hypothetical protein FA95DRAFT_1603332 [Auriscalpium vulgare]
MGQQGIYNAVYIFPDQADYRPLHSFDDLRALVDQCALPATADGSIQEGEYGALLVKGGAPVQVIADFYDRNPDAYTWYYTAYALSRGTPGDGLNSIASAIVPPSKGPIYGPVIVVKNAPASVWSSQGKAVSDEGVVRTVWWYIKSGVDPEEVFKERTLIRLFADRDM